MHRCVYHAYKGDQECPWCREAKGLQPKSDWSPDPHACKFCESPDMRVNEIAQPHYRWCAACGKRVEERETQGVLL